MNTPTNAYLTRFSSGTILAMLVLSGMAILIPVAAPVFAAQNASQPTLTATPNAVVAATATAFAVTVKNPSTNAYAISSVTVTAPTGWSFSVTATTNPCTGAFLTTLAASSSTGFQCTGGATGTTVLSPGFSSTITFTASGGLTLTGPASPATSPAVTGVFTTSLIDTGSSPAAYAGPSFTEYSIATTTVAAALAPTNTVFVAGGSAYTVTATLSSGQQGVPIVWSFANGAYPSTGFTATLSPTSGTSDSTGKATTSFTPSNKQTDNTGITATVGTSAVAGTSAVVTTTAGSPSKITFQLSLAAFPATHYVTAFIPLGAPAVNYADVPAGLVTYFVSDAFGNSITASTFTSTIVAASSQLTATGGFFGAVTTTTTSGITSGNYGTVPEYSQSGTYGTVGAITGALTATYAPTGASFSVSASSGFIKTSTFDGSSNTPLPYGSSVTTGTPVSCTAGAPCIPAGKTFTVRSKLTNTQTGVPITLYALPVPTTQTGLFSNGAKSITVSSNSSGISAATFTADTLATDAVKFIANATAPTDSTSVTHALGASGPSITVTTIPGTATTFVVTLAYTSGFTAIVKSAVVAGATYFVNVALSDAYGNAVTSTSATQIQINLATTQGVLSATSVYITQNNADTKSSFGPISVALPSSLATGTAVTVTASGAVGGTAVSGTKTVTSISPLPTLVVTLPKATGGAIISGSTTVVFQGNANASLGYQSSILVVSIGYKVNSNPWQTITVSGNKVPWSIATTFPANQLSTIQFNATDSNSPANTFVATAMAVLVDTSAPTITWTTTAGSTVTSPSVSATITDTVGDLNATSVTANYNGTSVAASSISVVGTNALGSSVTYTVTVAGLPTGHWIITMNAKDLAGNAAAATTLNVKVSVASNKSFTPPTPLTSCTNSGFTGVCATWTNNLGTASTVNVWFVAYNSKNQVVYASFTQLSFTTGGANTLFQGLSSSLPSGTYTVNVFVVTPAGQAVSPPNDTTPGDVPPVTVTF